MLSLFFVEFYFEFSPFSGGSVLSEFSPFWVQSIQGWVHSGFSTFGVESIRGSGPLEVQSHSGLSPTWCSVPFGFSPIRCSVHSDISLILGSVVLGSVGESRQPIQQLRLQQQQYSFLAESATAAQPVTEVLLSATEAGQAAAYAAVELQQQQCSFAK